MQEESAKVLGVGPGGESARGRACEQTGWEDGDMGPGGSGRVSLQEQKGWRDGGTGTGGAPMGPRRGLGRGWGRGLGGGEAVKSGGDRDRAEGRQDQGEGEVWGRGRARELKGRAREDWMGEGR